MCFTQKYSRIGTSFMTTKNIMPQESKCIRTPFSGYNLLHMPILVGGPGLDESLMYLDKDIIYEDLDTDMKDETVGDIEKDIQKDLDTKEMDEKNEDKDEEILGSGILTDGGALRLAGQRKSYHRQLHRRGCGLSGKIRGKDPMGSGILTDNGKTGRGIHIAGSGLSPAGSGLLPGDKLRKMVIKELKKRRKNKN